MARWSLGALALVGFALRLAVGVRAAEEVEADGRPDWNHYVQVQTLSEADLRFNDGGRLIIVGDIHGMNHSLHALLTKLKYNPSLDTLVPAGDLLTKSPLPNTLSTLSFLAAHNVPAVRGNNDQPAVRWRSWQDWIASQPARGGNRYKALGGRRMSGAQWLAHLDRTWSSRGGDSEDEEEREAWLAEERRRGPRAWWARTPVAWRAEMLGEDYRIARGMTEGEAKYLRARPAILHVPALHLFVAHAGVLPYDTTRKPTHASQPLARAPHGDASTPLDERRRAQETGVLEEVWQNVDPWTPLHMRAVRRDGSLSKEAKEGTFWAKIWNKSMRRCGGFDVEAAEDGEWDDELDDIDFDEDDLEDELEGVEDLDDDDGAEALRKKKKRKLPCMPITTVYAHTAAYGLDMRRWSVGLDSGCVYGRSLTALVLDRHSLTVPPKKRVWKRDEQVVFGGVEMGDDAAEEGDEEEDDEVEDAQTKVVRPSWIPFGEHGSAKIVDVKCKSLE